ncbi:hypothetical protein [Actinomyces culturomici]|uniref:hypothetical protein n=1 Tax=Actinomyces culturomici TaxID=1926276 RepID=UPI000E20246B|nr:hypothetical protein [Actinomyces culturomici]
MTDEFTRFDPDADVEYRNGERVTRDMIDGLAKQAERTGPPPGLIPGGKSLSGEGVHSPKIQVVLSARTQMALKERAAADNMSVSKWVRRLIESEIDSPKGSRLDAGLYRPGC